MKTGSQGLARKVERLLGEIGVLTFEAPADEAYGRLRWGLESAGRVIGPNDLLIAAHALSLGLVLVTGNVGEFSRVRELRVENWMSGIE
jgi:tRNA(fMet)-specific endonuclease VapC